MYLHASHWDANFQSFPSYSLKPVTQGSLQSIIKGRGGEGRGGGRWEGPPEPGVRVTFPLISILYFNSDAHFPYLIILGCPQGNFDPRNSSK